MENLAMNKLSFIVPVYNVEQYLRKCVDSLLSQDVPASGYEIILVDDGGQDKCPQICDEYAAAHENIRVIHQKNGGLSAARNAGIKIAKGGYVCFVDSDDYWEENVLGGLLDQVEREELDVLRFDYQNVRVVDAKHLDSSNLDATHLEYEVFQPYKFPHKVDRIQDVVDGETYLNERMIYNCYVTQFIIKREIVPLFTEGIHFEDVDWLPRMMLHSKRVNSTEMVVYCYLHRPGSITQTQGNLEKIRKNVEDKMYVLEQYAGMMKHHPDCLWLCRMSSMMASNVLTEVAISLYPEKSNYIQRLRNLGMVPLDIADQGKTYTRRAKIINTFGMHAYCWLMHIKNI